MANNLRVVKVLVLFIAMDSGDRIQADYERLPDNYHVLGACSSASVWAAVCAIAFIATTYSWNPSLSNVPFVTWQFWEVAAGIGLMSIIVTRVFTRNRNAAWHALTDTTGTAAYLWEIHHPEFPTANVTLQEIDYLLEVTDESEKDVPATPLTTPIRELQDVLVVSHWKSR